jgi:hypothetical protein
LAKEWEKYATHFDSETLELMRGMKQQLNSYQVAFNEGSAAIQAL